MKYLIAILLASVVSCYADTNSPSLLRNLSTVESGELFAKGDTVIGIAASYTASEPRGLSHVFDTNARHGLFGFNFSTTHFLSEYIGIGVDAGITDYNNPNNLIFDTITTDITFRYPLGHIAPYAIVGLGRDMGNGSYNTQLGGGVEIRANHMLGIFADARMKVQTDTHKDALVVRSGVAFNF